MQTQKRQHSSRSVRTRILRGSQYGAELTRAATRFARRHAKEFERETGLHFRS